MTDNMFITKFRILIFVASGVLFAQCEQSDRLFSGECIVSRDSLITRISLINNEKQSNVIRAKTFNRDSCILISEWPLEFPVFRFECGDINNNGTDDILAGVIKKTRFDTVSRKRIFIFKLFEGYVRPLWLGSRVSMPLEDFRFVKRTGKNMIRTIEKERSGNYLVAEYEWEGFGLAFIGYLARETDPERANKLLFIAESTAIQRCSSAEQGDPADPQGQHSRKHCNPEMQ
ncbi:MAG: nuclear receptor-binding factor 2 [Bacteroidetes bacterium]|nr:nuclear receptor-binding factor 2 [Bacteroidota bacterium]